MEFQPKTEREIRDAMVLPAGTYDFEVTKAEEATSKKGNPMIALTLNVFPADGTSPRQIRDWLVGSMELKLNRFCRATGLEEAYNAGELNAFACDGVSGKAKVGIEPSAEYGDRNTVKDYVPALETPAAKTAPAAPAAKKPDPTQYEQELVAKGDEIPF